MGKASRTKQQVTGRNKTAARRAAERRTQVHRRVLLASGAIVAVIAIVVTFTVIALNTKKTAPSAVSNGPTGAALAKVVSDTTSVPPSILDTVGAGSVTTPPTAVSGTPLTAGGKPEVLYIGAEFCPYCALQQWGLVVALSRFGTFSGLRTVHSSSTDVYPDTPTWTFYGSSYTCRYLTFTPVEQASNVPDATAPLGYVPLQSPTAGQQALLRKYDPGLSIPFTDIGNKYVISGASASPQVLAGKSWAQIASSLHDGSGPVAQAVDGTANYVTAAICKLTNDQPITACTPTVTALASKMRRAVVPAGLRIAGADRCRICRERAGEGGAICHLMACWLVSCGGS
jgi:hypothetical protein